QLAVRKEATAEVTAEEVKAVVERAEHTHQRCSLLYSEVQMLRCVEDQRRIKDCEAERREDLNEKQCSRSLGGLSKTACEKIHPGSFVARRVWQCQAERAVLARSLMRICCCSEDDAVAAGVPRPRVEIAADTAASTKRIIKLPTR